MSLFWTVIGITAFVAVIAIFFFWYQERRARASLERLDRSRLKDWRDDGWDDW